MRSTTDAEVANAFSLSNIEINISERPRVEAKRIKYYRICNRCNPKAVKKIKSVYGNKFKYISLKTVNSFSEGNDELGEKTSVGNVDKFNNTKPRKSYSPVRDLLLPKRPTKKYIKDNMKPDIFRQDSRLVAEPGHSSIRTMTNRKRGNTTEDNMHCVKITSNSPTYNTHQCWNGRSAATANENIKFGVQVQPLTEIRKEILYAKQINEGNYNNLQEYIKWICNHGETKELENVSKKLEKDSCVWIPKQRYRNLMRDVDKNVNVQQISDECLDESSLSSDSSTNSMPEINFPISPIIQTNQPYQVSPTETIPAFLSSQNNSASPLKEHMTSVPSKKFIISSSKPKTFPNSTFTETSKETSFQGFKPQTCQNNNYIPNTTTANNNFLIMDPTQGNNFIMPDTPNPTSFMLPETPAPSNYVLPSTPGSVNNYSNQSTFSSPINSSPKNRSVNGNSNFGNRDFTQINSKSMYLSNAPHSPKSFVSTSFASSVNTRPENVIMSLNNIASNIFTSEKSQNFTTPSTKSFISTTTNNFISTETSPDTFVQTLNSANFNQCFSDNVHNSGVYVCNQNQNFTGDKMYKNFGSNTMSNSVESTFNNQCHWMNDKNKQRTFSAQSDSSVNNEWRSERCGRRRTEGSVGCGQMMGSSEKVFGISTDSIYNQQKSANSLQDSKLKNTSPNLTNDVFVNPNNVVQLAGLKSPTCCLCKTQKIHPDFLVAYQKLTTLQYLELNLMNLIVDTSHQTTLNWAVYHGRTAMVQHIVDNWKKQQLELAQTINQNGHQTLNINETILPKLNPLNLNTKHKESALSFACTRGFIEIVKMLLLQGSANCNPPIDSNGGTPLLYAIQQAYPTIVKLMIMHGAKVTDCGDYSAYELALELKHYECATIIKNCLADKIKVQNKVQNKNTMIAPDGPFL